MTHSCPYCSAPILNSWEAPGQKTNRAEPSPGDATICTKCAGICVVNTNLSRRKVTEQELAAIDDDLRRLLTNAVAMIKARIAKRN